MLFHARRLVGPEWVGWQGAIVVGVEGGPSRPMSEPNVPSRRSRIAVIALGVAALSLALPMAAHADDDDDHHGKRHRNHSRSYYQNDDGYYGPPPLYYGGPPPCRGRKNVRVYNHYYPVPVPVAVPVYPAYPQEYPQQYAVSGSNAVVRIGVDWILDF